MITSRSLLALVGIFEVPVPEAVILGRGCPH